MPKIGDIDNSYPAKLTKIGIKLKEPFKGAKQHHVLQCVVCNHTWSATPLSKIQAFKKRKNNGCPNCNTIRFEAKKIDQLKIDINNLRTRNIEVIGIVEPGQLHLTTKKLKFKNTECGHTFETYPGNVLHRNIDCPTCGKNKRSEQLTQTVIDRHEEWVKTASEWKIYKSKVTSLTVKTYNKYKDQINPNNLPRGKAGILGAYHLDHLVPIRYCFDNNIPESVCAHHTNLQMLSWEANIGAQDKLKEDVDIPSIFKDYIIPPL